MLIHDLIVGKLISAKVIENILGNGGLLISSSSTEVIKVTIKPLIDLFMNLIVMITDLLGSLSLLESFSLSSSTIFISTTNVEGIMTLESAISGIDISREDTTNNVAQVRYVVHIG